MTPLAGARPTKMCDVEGCRLPARFQVGFIAPFKRVIIAPDSMAKEFQMWLALGVCGSHRDEIKTVDQLLNEEQINMLNASQTKLAKPSVDFAAGFVMFDEVALPRGHANKVTGADGRPLERKLVQQKQIIRA